MMLYINVPYAEKDEAKSLGAKWNPTRKQWLIKDKKDYYKFKKWFPKGYSTYFIICDYIYLVDKKRQCPYCKSFSKEVKALIPEFYFFYEEPDEFGDYFEYSNENQEPRIVSLSSIKGLLSNDILSFLKFKYSISLENNRFIQHCKYCNKRIKVSPSCDFGIYSIDEVDNFTLYKFKIKEDIIVESLPWCSSDIYIVKYAKRYDSKLK
ncbi:MAG: DUF5710 domain-containing protein [Acutalibacteraceae bacterium]